MLSWTKHVSNSSHDIWNESQECKTLSGLSLLIPGETQEERDQETKETVALKEKLSLSYRKSKQLQSKIE